MVDTFVSFVRTIAIYLIFYAFVEMLLPKSNLKKYVNLCLGLLMIMIVLEPIVGLLNGGTFQLQAVDLQLQQKIDANDEYEKLQSKLIMDSYKSQIAEQINGMIFEKLNISIEAVELDVADDFGKINSIKIFVKQDLDNGTPKDDEINKIKNVISNFYNINIDNIYVIEV